MSQCQAKVMIIEAITRSRSEAKEVQCGTRYRSYLGPGGHDMEDAKCYDCRMREHDERMKAYNK